MISWFTKHFIPHPENDHRPHFLHKKNTRALLALVIAFELLIYVLPTITFVDRVDRTNLASVLPAVLSSLTNEERVEIELPELNVSPVLTKAAELKARDMAEKGYFAHTSPDGKSPWYWLEQVGYEYDYAGENLAINFTDSKDVTEAWMDSPKHRANIVKTSYTEVGTGIATGVFEGEKTIFVAQIYANPRTEVALAVENNQSSPEQVQSAELNKQIEQASSAENLVLEVEDENSSGVLGAEIQSIEEKADHAPARAQNTSVKLPAQPDFQPKLTGADKALTAPRHATNIIFGIILLIVSAAIILNVFIQIKVQHADLITNGLFVVTVILAVLVINNFLGPKDIAIGQSTDYSKDQAITDAL